MTQSSIFWRYLILNIEKEQMKFHFLINFKEATIKHTFKYFSKK